MHMIPSRHVVIVAILHKHAPRLGQRHAERRSKHAHVVVHSSRLASHVPCMPPKPVRDTKTCPCFAHPHAGQTSALGQPKPGSKQNTDGSSNAGEEGSKAQWVDPRAEPPMPDNTGKYAAIGAVSGVFLGWASQFF